MEGGLTIYFPPHYSMETLIQGAQLSTLNAIREMMEYGGLAQMADPSVMKLKLLDSSYSLRPIIPPSPEVMDVGTKGSGGGEGSNNANMGGLIVGIMIPLLLLCCCGCCLLNFKRRGGKFEDIHEMLLPVIDPKRARELKEEQARALAESESLKKSSNKKKKSSKTRKIFTI